jgi:putative endonuclease
MYYVYILQSEKLQKNYIGTTNSLKRRLIEHNSGNVKYTKHGKPYKLIWYCAFNNKKKAFDFENYLKKGSGHAFMYKRLI